MAGNAGMPRGRAGPRPPAFLNRRAPEAQLCRVGNRVGRNCASGAPGFLACGSLRFYPLSGHPAQGWTTPPPPGIPPQPFVATPSARGDGGNMTRAGGAGISRGLVWNATVRRVRGGGVAGWVWRCTICRHTGGGRYPVSPGVVWGGDLGHVGLGPFPGAEGTGSRPPPG